MTFPMLKLLSVLLVLMSCNVHAQECVVLLHGLARSSGSMEKMALALEDRGYSVANHRYRSTTAAIQELAAKELPKALAKCPPAAKIHFVTHSMGGILLRQYLVDNEIAGLWRTVMLGPPNQGSQVVDRLKRVPGYRLINGPAGMQLGADTEGLPATLGRVNFELGVIAGSKSINLVLSTMLPNPDDGKVSVENTKVEGMTDHITLPITHPFMMKNPQAIRQVIHFLRAGSFDHAVPKNSPAPFPLQLDQ